LRGGVVVVGLVLGHRYSSVAVSISRCETLLSYYTIAKLSIGNYNVSGGETWMMMCGLTNFRILC